MNSQDYIEVGQGVDSKVIGKDNSVSEYFAVVMSLATYAVQAWFIAFVTVFLIVGFYWLEWAWAGVVAFIVTTIIPIAAIFGAVALFRRIKDIQEPIQERDDRGRFARRRTKVFRMTKHVGDIMTAENGDTEYISRWGGGG